MGNLISLFGAVSANGKLLIENPSVFYRDVNASNILWVKQPVSVTDSAGTVVQAFQIYYQNPRGLVVEIYYLPVEANLANLTDFLAGLVALGGARNQFTIYNNLFKTSNQSQYQLPGNQSVLINNDFIDAVNYMALANLTQVIVNQVNSLSKFYMFFTGKQNASGQYEYFVKTGNV